MREIKFRGKRIDNGMWVYGSLVNNLFFNAQTQEPAFYILNPDEYEDYDSFDDTEDIAVRVDPETVGQYTGLKDSKGKEIYEGDITISSGGTYEVIWEAARARWLMRVIKSDYVLVRGCAFPLWQYVQDDGLCKFVVIGDRWGNPELLEV